MDYRKYRAGFVEKLACAAVGAGAAGMAAWLFYRSVWGMLLFPAAYLVCVKKYCTLQKEKRKEQLLMEFQGCHAVCIGGAAGRIFCRKCMEGDGERTSGIAWGEGIYGGRGALDE